MSDLFEKLRKYATVITIVGGLVGISVLLLGQQQGLAVMGVVYQETLQKELKPIKLMLHGQSELIDSVKISLDNHAALPGHGESIVESNNLERRVVMLETNANEMSKSNQELAIATARLTEQVKQLNKSIDRMPHR